MVDLLISWLFYAISDFFAILNFENIAMSRNIFLNALRRFTTSKLNKIFLIRKVHTAGKLWFQGTLIIVVNFMLFGVDLCVDLRLSIV